MSQTTSVPDSSQLAFTSAWAPTACHFGKSITVSPSPAAARNEAGSRSRKRPLRSKSWTSTAWIGAPASCAPTGGAMASGNGWTRPPERSITGRSGAASSRAKRKAEVTGISRSEVQDDAAVAERARQIGGRRRELRLLDRELERLIEEFVAGLLLDNVPEDAAVGPDVCQHGGGEVEPLALRDHRRHHVLFQDRVVHRGEVGVAFLGAGGGALRGAGRRSGPLRVEGTGGAALAAEAGGGDSLRGSSFGSRGRPSATMCAMMGLRSGGARSKRRGSTSAAARMTRCRSTASASAGTAGIRPCGASRLRGALSLKAFSAPDPDR